ncbi:MAG: hemolysin family protein [Acidimicrobiia bacterium]|nr:hemolysin family protein [Acidimicrobiia bacterium]
MSGILAVVLLVAANGFFVAGEFALVAVERSHVERLAAGGDKRARVVLRSLSNLSFELSGAQLGITVTSLIVGAIAEPAMATLLEPLVERVAWIPPSSALGVSVALAIAIATVSQMVFAELTPKNLALARPYASAVWFAIPMQYVNKMMGFFIRQLNAAANWTVRKLGIEPRDELAGVRSMEELELMIRSSGQGGQLADDEMTLLTKVIAFTEKVAADVMVPRVDVTGLNRHDSVAELRRLTIAMGHSRFPVYDADLDQIVGVVNVKDTFATPADRRSIEPVGSITRPALAVPESCPLDEVLASLQREGTTMAVVVDEYGGTAGIVTMEDLLEEILGEIEDEYDEAEAEPSMPADVLSGLLHRHEVEELTGFEWPEGRYETLGGFIIATLKRFPRVGDVVRIDDHVFRIESVDGRRVDQVRVRREGAL